VKAHQPHLYIGGVYIQQTNVWLGEFDATRNELLDYSETDVRTVQEFEIVISMAVAQYEYEAWWNRTQNGKRRT
jgi:hypothetical protein